MQGREHEASKSANMPPGDENHAPLGNSSAAHARNIVDARKKKLADWQNKKKMQQQHGNQASSTRPPFMAANKPADSGFPAAPAMPLQQRNLNVVSRYSLAGRKDKRKKPARKSIELVVTGDENMPAGSLHAQPSFRGAHKPLFNLERELAVAPVKNLGSLFQDEDKTCFLSEMLADLQVQTHKVRSPARARCFCC